MTKFRVIEGGDTPKPYHKRGLPQQIICRTCEVDIGIATSLWMTATQSPMSDGNRVIGGTKVTICAHCLMRGKVTQQK